MFIWCIRKETSEDLGVDGRIILKLLKEIGFVDWMHLAQDMALWPAIMNTFMNRRAS